jgi:hypothetical protein
LQFNPQPGEVYDILITFGADWTPPTYQYFVAGTEVSGDQVPRELNEFLRQSCAPNAPLHALHQDLVADARRNGMLVDVTLRLIGIDATDELREAFRNVGVALPAES